MKNTTNTEPQTAAGNAPATNATPTAYRAAPESHRARDRRRS